MGQIIAADLLHLVTKEQLRPDRPDDGDGPQMVDQVWELAEWCWKSDSQQRPTAGAVCDVIAPLLALTQRAGSGNIHEQRSRDGEKQREAEDGHSDGLRMVHNMANSLSSQGQYGEAVDLHQLLGREHPDTLKTLSALADTLVDQGKHEAAEILFREIAQSREKTLGKDHPDTLGTLHNLAHTLRSQGKYDVAESLSRQVANSHEKTLVMSTVVESYSFGALNFQLLKATSDCAQHPSVTINAPRGWVILGGGAFVDWDGPCSPPSPPGNLLTGMFPNGSGTTWTVTSKDHHEVSKARIIGYCVVAQMKNGTPIEEDNYRVVADTSAVLPHPTLQVTLPSSFTLVGGGARANYGGFGSLLYASFPKLGADTWIGSAKDHIQPDSSSITVWAIGLRRSFLSKNGMGVTTVARASPVAHHPRISAVIPGFHITGGGGRVDWKTAGSLLTASFPQSRETWVAEGKDHIVEDPSAVTAWAIGFK
jgi:hypothetical protein